MDRTRNTGFDPQKWYDALMDRRTREALRLRARAFETEHRNDTDVMLLDTIRARARELGYVPFASEHPGRAMITRRFGSWDGALRLAGLSRPRGAKLIRDTHLYRDEYRRQQKLHRTEKARKQARRRSKARKD